MKFMTGLFGRKSGEEMPRAQRVHGIDVEPGWQNGVAEDAPVPPLPRRPAMSLEEAFEYEDEAPLMSIDQVVSERAKKEAAPSMNIWDLEDDTPEAPVAPVAEAALADNRASARARRNRTRLIGFDKSDGDVVDLFESTPKAGPAQDRIQFPVGWILVIEGPGRGFSFPLVAGMSQIGRGEDQTISLDFGDTAISRNNHAAIVYDTNERAFLLGHGGKANLVRLNGKPVISNETLSNGDKITLGETTLQLTALCGPDFDWSDTDGEEDQEDVAIA